MRAFPFIFICIQFLLINVVYADTATEVTVVHPLTELRGSALRLVGTVEAVQHAQLASEQSGRVDKIFVDVGDEVEKDQALLRLDDSLAKLAVAETASKVDAAAIELAEAKRLLKEVESLSQRQVIAATLVDERRARVASAAATVTQEQAILSYRKKIVEKHTLKAPFAGLVEHRSVSLGEWLSVQSVPFRLVSNDNFRVRVHIPQEYYFSLRQSSSPTVTVHHERLPSALEGLTINRLIAVSQQGARRHHRRGRRVAAGCGAGLRDRGQRRDLLWPRCDRALPRLYHGDGHGQPGDGHGQHRPPGRGREPAPWPEQRAGLLRHGLLSP